jgi:hypothetical protein
MSGIILGLIAVDGGEVFYYPKSQKKIKEVIAIQIVPKIPKSEHMKTLTEKE